MVNPSQVLTKAVTDSRAWRADTIDASSGWYYPLATHCLSAIDQAVQAFRRKPQETTAVQVSDDLRAACADCLKPVLADLESVRGFAIIEGIPAQSYSAQETQVVYWMLGQMLGRPFEQNVQGTLLYDVRDTGQDVRYGARFSVTNADSTFHTDNSFGSQVLDYVGLLCLNTAKVGGWNQIVSGYTVHNELLANHPDVLAVLYKPFHVDRRGGLRQGERPTSPVPVFEWDGHELICRYLRYWIEAGHEKIGQPLAPTQRNALDVLDQVLQRRDLRVEFGLKPGQMFFINNRWILHSRTAFEDHPEPERKRHYVRLWLQQV
jgi:alpha-ketoglutarate-dependent taurine dioxygenase